MPESVKTFRDTGEDHLHRIMWRWKYPEDVIDGWILTRRDICSFTYCVNPEHYFKGYYNGSRRAGPTEKLASGRPNEPST